jgi:hypothetical protein
MKRTIRMRGAILGAVVAWSFTCLFFMIKMNSDVVALRQAAAFEIRRLNAENTDLVHRHTESIIEINRRLDKLEYYQKLTK